MREKHQPRARRQKKKKTIKLKETLNKARFPLVKFDWEGMTEKIISQELAEP